MADTHKETRIFGNRYEVSELIAVGGTSKVFQGIDLRLERPVAIKILNTTDTDDKAARHRFLQEVSTIAKLSHPHIVSVYDFGFTDDDIGFLIMQLTSGKTLVDEIRRGPMSQSRFSLVMKDLLSALSAAHLAGVIHRDLKPSNVLLTDYDVKLTDFGIAKTIDDPLDLTKTGEMIGTPTYMAPEVLGGARATTQSDVYSVGVIAFETFTGQRYVRNNFNHATVKSETGANNVYEWIDRALSIDPARRPKDASELWNSFPYRSSRGSVRDSTAVLPIENDRTQVISDSSVVNAGDFSRRTWHFGAAIFFIALLVYGILSWTASQTDKAKPVVHQQPTLTTLAVGPTTPTTAFKPVITKKPPPPPPKHKKHHQH